MKRRLNLKINYDILKEFCIEGRLAFHIGMLPNGKKNGWDIVTNIPQEILNRNIKEVRQLAFIVQSFKLSQEEYINELAEIIKRDELSQIFYYPKYILDNTNKLPAEAVDYLYEVFDGFDLEPNSFFSENHEPLEFYILLQKFYRIKHFYPEEFDTIVPCTKQEFENNIPDAEAAGQYFDLYADNNKYLFCEEDGMELYFLIKEGRPCMIMIR